MRLVLWKLPKHRTPAGCLRYEFVSAFSCPTSPLRFELLLADRKPPQHPMDATAIFGNPRMINPQKITHGFPPPKKKC